MESPNDNKENNLQVTDNVSSKELVDNSTIPTSIKVESQESVVEEQGNGMDTDPVDTEALQNIQSSSTANSQPNQKLSVSEKPLNNDVNVKEEVTDISNGTVKGENTSVSSDPALQVLKCTKCFINFPSQQALLSHTTNKNCREISLTSTADSNSCLRQKFCSVKKLIKCVHNCSFFYDSNHKDYKNRPLKNKIWNSIASKCQFRNGAAAKAEWKKLKSHFMITLTKNYNNEANPFPYGKYMKFLMPHIFKPVKSDQSETSNRVENNTTMTEPQAPEEAVVNDTVSDVQNEPPSKKPKTTQSQDAATSTPQRMGITSGNPIGLAAAGNRLATSSDPMDMFFLSMYETTRNLPVCIQLQIKKKIFQVVVEAEELIAELNNNQQN